MLDVDDVPVTAVDDLELSDVPFDTELRPGTAAPVIESLLSGPVLGTRIFGGRPPALLAGTRGSRTAHSASVSRAGYTVAVDIRVGFIPPKLALTDQWIQGYFPHGLSDSGQSVAWTSDLPASPEAGCFAWRSRTRRSVPPSGASHWLCTGLSERQRATRNAHTAASSRSSRPSCMPRSARVPGACAV